jgi:hypothetical protein
MGFDANGSLGLCGRSTNYTLELNKSDELELRPTRSDPRHHYQAFTRTNGVAGHGYNLRVATYPDGSRVFLDSRGLLHLMAKGVPQLTLTLTDRPCAGWTSHGETFGWAYFLPEEATSDAAMAWMVLRTFARRVQ